MAVGLARKGALARGPLSLPEETLAPPRLLAGDDGVDVVDVRRGDRAGRGQADAAARGLARGDRVRHLFEARVRAVDEVVGHRLARAARERARDRHTADLVAGDGAVV